MRPIIRGSALKALEGEPKYVEAIKKLMETVDSYVPTPAREIDKPFLMPIEDVFSISTVAPARAVWWMHGQDPARAKLLARALYDAYFQQDINISNPADTVRVAAAALGVDAAKVEAALNDPAVKDKLRVEVDAAIARGVFGSPIVFVDDEPFWGVDRFDHIDRWLREGGF